MFHYRTADHHKPMKTLPNPVPSRSIEEVIPLLVQVQRDLDEDLNLDTLARRFGYSPFHFHRRFKEVVGETPRQYVQRLRLEKAAYKLQITNASILDISLAVGFQNHETFTRAFRQHFGCAPSRYREEGRMAQAERLGRKRSFRGDECVVSEVRFEIFRPMHFLAIRNVGDYYDIADAFSEEDRLWNDLVAWARANNVRHASLALGLFHDDPTVTPRDAQRCDACIPIHDPVEGTPRIRRIEFAGGPHGVVEHTGPDSTLLEGFQRLADDIRRSTEYEFRDASALEIYRNLPLGAGTVLDQTDLCFPVRKKAKS